MSAALRIRAPHLATLAALHHAGSAGVAYDALLVPDGRADYRPGDLIAHGLAEQFTDPRRLFPDRIRLTPTGSLWAGFLTRSAA